MFKDRYRGCLLRDFVAHIEPLSGMERLTCAPDVESRNFLLITVASVQYKVRKYYIVHQSVERCSCLTLDKKAINDTWYYVLPSHVCVLQLPIPTQVSRSLNQSGCCNTHKTRQQLRFSELVI